MCGIAGYFGQRKFSDTQIDLVLRSMSHRGPDDRGYYHKETKANQNLYLFHTRLAIIDLDPRSNQPMKIGNKVLCFNGEIYNYKECKKKLIEKHRLEFTTQSDTEVLLQMLSQGENHAVLNQLEGMWAYALFDENSEVLDLCRDRFGEKPVYYFQDETGFYFASELSILFSMLIKQPKINRRKIYTYLYSGYRSLHRDDETFFENVFLLKNHHILKIKSGKISDHQSYWKIPESQDPYKSNSEAVDDIRSKLFHAVDIRLRSDVPIAFCMSGGIDSLTLISIAKKICNYDVHGFTIDHLDERYNERTIVDDAVASLDIRHTYIKPSKDDFFPTLSELIVNRGFPVSTISYYVHALLMQDIHRKGYKVSISGTGADELFTGYYDHFLYHIALQKDDRDVRENWEKFIKPYVRNPVFQEPLQFVNQPNYRDYLYEDYSIHNQGPRLDQKSESHYSHNILRNRMLNELFEEVVPVILLEDDHNSMRVSVENRSPFLDTDLLSASLRIPENSLIQEGYGKFILREAVKGIVPELARTNRRKTGFNASLFELLPQSYLHELDSNLSDSSEIFSYVDRAYIRDLFSKNIGNEKFLFNFLCAKIFLDSYS